MKSIVKITIPLEIEISINVSGTTEHPDFDMTLNEEIRDLKDIIAEDLASILEWKDSSISSNCITFPKDHRIDGIEIDEEDGQDDDEF